MRQSYLNHKRSVRARSLKQVPKNHLSILLQVCSVYTLPERTHTPEFQDALSVLPLVTNSLFKHCQGKGQLSIHLDAVSLIILSWAEHLGLVSRLKIFNLAAAALGPLGSNIKSLDPIYKPIL